MRPVRNGQGEAERAAAGGLGRLQSAQGVQECGEEDGEFDLRGRRAEEEEARGERQAERRSGAGARRGDRGQGRHRQADRHSAGASGQDGRHSGRTGAAHQRRGEWLL